VLNFRELITIENELVVATAPLASVNRTVIAKVPAVLGVPEITPVLVFRVTEPGNDPDARAYVPEPVPPVTELLRVNEVPRDPLKPELGVAIVTEVAVHCAYKTIEDAEIGIVFEAFSVNAVPEPLVAVFQPLNVYPVRVNGFAAVVNEVPPCALPPVGALPDPLFAL
jgi:hypothetical protein